MKKYLRLSALAGAAALLLLGSTSYAVSSSQDNFSAHLTGAAERPTPVKTRAQGQTILRLSEDGTTLYYKLIVANITDVTMAHIHLANADSAGPVVAFLFGPVMGGTGKTQGVLAEGVITQANLIPRPAIGFGGTMEELAAAIRAGNAYVNVHTLAYPAGEIRGQIR